MSFEPIRFLSATDIEFESLPHGDLAAVVAGVRYEYVRAFRTQPVSAPDQFISLRAPDPDEKGKEKEIGILKDLRTLTPEARKLVGTSLARRYLMNVITGIHHMWEEFGYLHWEVETENGPHSFTTSRWHQGHVLEMGDDGEGRIIIDIYGNRAFIPNLQQLDEKSRAVFLRFIYW